MSVERGPEISRPPAAAQRPPATDAATIEKLEVNGDHGFDSEDMLPAIVELNLLAADLASLRQI